MRRHIPRGPTYSLDEMKNRLIIGRLKRDGRGLEEYKYNVVG